MVIRMVFHGIDSSQARVTIYPYSTHGVTHNQHMKGDLPDFLAVRSSATILAGNSQLSYFIRRLRFAGRGGSRYFTVMQVQEA